MNSPEIPITDPFVMTMLIAFGVLFVATYVDNWLDKRTKRQGGKITRRTAIATIVIYWVNIYCLLAGGVAIAALLRRDGSVEAAMFAPLAAICFALFIWGWVFKAFKPFREACAVLRTSKSTR